MKNFKQHLKEELCGAIAALIVLSVTVAIAVYVSKFIGWLCAKVTDIISFENWHVATIIVLALVIYAFVAAYRKSRNTLN